MSNPRPTFRTRFPAPSSIREPLTPAEEQVLRLLAHAHSRQEIARQLLLGADAVADVKATAMRKAGLKTRLDVLAYANQHGWT